MISRRSLCSFCCPAHWGYYGPRLCFIGGCQAQCDAPKYLTSLCDTTIMIVYLDVICSGILTIGRKYLALCIVCFWSSRICFYGYKYIQYIVTVFLTKYILCGFVCVFPVHWELYYHYWVFFLYVIVTASPSSCWTTFCGILLYNISLCKVSSFCTNCASNKLVSK